MSEPSPLETSTTNALSSSASAHGPLPKRGEYIPDYRRNEGSIFAIISAFTICAGALVLTFNLRVSKDKVIYAEEARLVGISKAEEVSGNVKAYSIIATNYANWIYTRGPEGITHAEMLPFICTDECKADILAKQTNYLREKKLQQTINVRAVDVVKQFKKGMEVQITAVLRQTSTDTLAQRVQPPIEQNVIIDMVLEYSHRTNQMAQYPFLATSSSIESVE